MVKFDVIAKDIIEKDKFQSLRCEPHHGLSRYDHVLRVAKNTYRISKLLRIDYVSATRGALLHDYFNDDDYNNTKGLKKGSMHPVIALNNARREYFLNQKEENIIVSHMFPVAPTRIPKYLESWIVNLIDDYIAIKEELEFKKKQAIGFTNLILAFLIAE